MAKLGSSPGEQKALLAAALEGLEMQKERLEAQIQQVRTALGAKGPRAAKKSAGGGGGVVRRRLSDAARKRIAAAQRKRWNAYRKAKAQGGKT